MKNKFATLLLLFFGICFTSFTFFEKKEIQDSKWTPIKFDKNLTVPKIEADDWSYPWYILKHKDGDFENITADTILPQDTIHLIHNAKCYSFLKKNKIVNKRALSRLRFCEAEIQSDSLMIKIYDFSVSNTEAVFLTIYNDQFRFVYNTAYVFPYKNLEFNYLNQFLKLNKKPPYIKGDIILGEIEAEFIESTIYEKETPTTSKTKVIKGYFEVEIK